MKAAFHRDKIPDDVRKEWNQFRLMQVYLSCVLIHAISTFFKYQLPIGIEELCFPDMDSWRPHSPNSTRTYSVVLTDPDGKRFSSWTAKYKDQHIFTDHYFRTFGYCQRIMPEGDTLCLPLAICILTKRRERRLYARVRFLSYNN